MQWEGHACCEHSPGYPTIQQESTEQIWGEQRPKGGGGSAKLQLYHIPSVLKLSSIKSSGTNVQGSSDALSQEPQLAASTLLPQLLCFRFSPEEHSGSFFLRLCLPSPTPLPWICVFEGLWKFTDLNIRRWEFPSLRDSFPLEPPQGLSGKPRVFNQKSSLCQSCTPL